MHNDLLDILSSKTSAITSEQLINYLSGTLDNNEKHELEKLLLNSGIENEALEGLQMIASREKLSQYESEINKALREKLLQKKKKRRSKFTVQLSFLVILTVALLVLITLVWLLIHLSQTSNH